MTVAEQQTCFPWPRRQPYGLPPDYRDRLAGQPVSRVELPSGQQVWLIARHDLFRQVLSDPRISSEHSHPNYPAIFPVAKRRSEQGQRPLLTYSGMDRPEHGTHRKVIAGSFSEKQIAKIRPQIQRIVDEHLDAMVRSGPPTDLVSALAEPVPSHVVSELLGVPMPIRPQLQRWTTTVFSRSASPAAVAEASRELRGSIAELLAERESGRSDDLLGTLVQAYQRRGEYDRAQLVEFAGAIITAGHETTANVISQGTVALLQHPDQLAEITAAPALLAGTVEELLRVLSIADLVTARVAIADLEIAGVTIRAGEGLIALGGAADHDPAVFADPDRLDIHRDAGRHVAFGYGIHKCLGQHLARLELQVVFGTLFSRLPTLRLAGEPAELMAREGAVFHGLAELPVAW